MVVKVILHIREQVTSMANCQIGETMLYDNKTWSVSLVQCEGFIHLFVWDSSYNLEAWRGVSWIVEYIAVCRIGGHLMNEDLSGDLSMETQLYINNFYPHTFPHIMCP